MHLFPELMLQLELNLGHLVDSRPYVHVVHDSAQPQTVKLQRKAEVDDITIGLLLLLLLLLAIAWSASAWRKGLRRLYCAFSRFTKPQKKAEKPGSLSMVGLSKLHP